MRSLSVSKEMITIAVSGCFMGAIGVAKYCYEYYLNYSTCTKEATYSFHIIILYHLLFFGYLNQIIIWSIVHITFHQALMVLKIRYGLCSETAYDSRRTISQCIVRLFLSISAIFGEVLPCTLLIIFCSILIFEINSHSSPDASSSIHSNSRQKAARALIQFLIFYFLAQFPLFLLYSLGLYNPEDFSQLDDYIYLQVDCLFFANMSIGILVYCLMSSEYRKTIWNIFAVEQNFLSNSTVVVKPLSHF
ncbi:unnamed protein product [Caenorhabditis angaria]|uniref:G-protein coupled receptors family 1 profile domain-containing protein n=1 Tax=Caenorhabditis angaria TaxID=860376 RepID=A0A9P1NAD1_9PELO|nr:unnamed protein product [Caenorhabditis angaria]